jgi:hypothetical protein
MKNLRPLTVWEKLDIYFNPPFDEEEKCIEVHADGVKEVTCGFCDVNCGNDYCYTNRKENND